MPLFGPSNVEKLKAKKNVTGLIKTMRNPRLDPQVRQAAADALGEIVDARAVAPLIAALDDENVRFSAAVALGKMGAPAVEPLIDVLKSTGWKQNAAAEALGKIGDARAVEPLIKILKESRKGEGKLIVEALGRIGDKRAVEPLIKAHNAGYWGESEAAAKALGGIGDARAVMPLIRNLTGTRPKRESMVNAAANALEKIGEPSVGPLVEGLSRGSYLRDVETVVIKVLGRIGRPSVNPLVKALVAIPRPFPSCVAALDEIGWQPTKDEAGAAYWVVKEDWDRCVKIGVPAVNWLIGALRSSSITDKEGAVQALKEIGEPAMVPLVEALGDFLHDRHLLTQALEGVDWQPTMDEAGARYWIAKKDWGKCVEIGTPAVAPLIHDLRIFGDRADKGAFEALVEIGEPAIEPLIAIMRQGNKLSGQVLQQIGSPAKEALTKSFYNWTKNERIAGMKILMSAGWQPDMDELSAIYWADKQQWDKCVEIGPIAVGPLHAAFSNEEWRERTSIAEALMSLGWQPGMDEAGAIYWIMKRNWEKCVEIGTLAVGPLKEAIKDRELYIRKTAAQMLDKLDWQPDKSEAAAAYWIENRQWDKCVEIGAPAVGALITELDNNTWEARKAPAQALAQIFQSGKLDDKNKRLILAQRDKIGKKHTDHQVHNDYPACQQPDGTHKDYRTHDDSGIGVNL